MYGLKPHIIQAIQDVFKNHTQVEKVMLYGSRAKGNYRTGSDIDLALMGEQIDLTLLQKIENRLDDLMLPYKIDISILHHISNTDLIEHINRIGKIFYVSENDG